MPYKKYPSVISAFRKLSSRAVFKKVNSECQDRRQFLTIAARLLKLDVLEILKAIGKRLDLEVLEELQTFPAELFSQLHAVTFRELQEYALAIVPSKDRTSIKAFACVDPQIAIPVLHRHPNMRLYLSPLSKIERAIENSQTEYLQKKSKQKAALQAAEALVYKVLDSIATEVHAFGATSFQISLLEDVPKYSFVAEGGTGRGEISALISEQLKRVLTQLVNCLGYSYLNVGEPEPIRSKCKTLGGPDLFQIDFLSGENP